MATSMNLRTMVKGSLRGAVAVFLCVLMVGQPTVALTKSKRAAPVKQIQSDERVLHALNRFTFGPRPGDVAAVQAMGVQRWFERQLDPASIDDSALEERLAAFPAMKMQQAELMERYPSPQVLRQIIEKNLPLPADPMEHALYADEIAFYKAQKAKQEAAKADAGLGGKASTGDETQAGMMSSVSKGDVNEKDGLKGKADLPGDTMDASPPEMAAQTEKLFSGLDAVKIINLPPEQRMQRILAMSPEELVALRKNLSQGELAEMAEGLTPLQRETLVALQGSPRMIGGELLASRMIRDIYSERQLEAVMTDFWLNHFNVYDKKNGDEPYLLPAYEREVIRPRALGKFEDLLVATAKSPAMLMYLDNWQSIGPDSQAARNSGKVANAAQNPQVKQALKERGLNENYARELMELHTLGVRCEVSEDHPVSALEKDCGQGYTQQDVTQVAQVLTGWTIDRPYRDGDYQFEERRHEPGSKVVLGATIPEGGEAEGLQVLHMLATSPATAKFISTKLAVRFVSDTPPPALVDRMAKAFVASGGDIKTVLRTMFDSPEFWSPEVYRAKLKTPEEFVVSAVRASDADVSNAVPLTQALAKLGMPFYGMQTPNGYSWMATAWLNTGDLVNRMNFALTLSGDHIAGVQTDWTGLLEQRAGGVEPTAMSENGSADGVDSAAAVKERKLEALLMGQPVSDQTRTTVLQQFLVQTTQQEATKSFSIRANGAEPMAAVLNPAAQQRKAKPPQDPQAAAMAGLLLGSPEFQRR
jgi:uncharacterized protein (DUF1800 family)